MKEIHYINLTNGIEAIQQFNLTDYRFIRIQSTACEQKRWDFILNTISDDFLMNAALDNICIVYDYSNYRDKPRAIWQGLEFIKFCLWKRWFNIEYKPQGRAINSLKYFNERYKKLKRTTKTRLDYFKKFTTSPNINILSMTNKTESDGKIDYYKQILLENNHV